MGGEDFGEQSGMYVSTQRHGLASQHLRTFERVPAAYSLFAGTVPAFNLFLFYWRGGVVPKSSILEFSFNFMSDLGGER